MEFKQIGDRWRKMSDEVIEGLRFWRQEYPQAREIETVLDEQLNRLRAQMLQDTAQVSQARVWSKEGAGMKCPVCGGELKGRGQQKRTLQTQGNQAVVLERDA